MTVCCVFKGWKSPELLAAAALELLWLLLSSHTVLLLGFFGSALKGMALAFSFLFIAEVTPLLIGMQIVFLLTLRMGNLLRILALNCLLISACDRF